MDTAVRVAGLGGRLYLDLANDQWQAVEISRDGWRVVNNPPVRFRRPRGVLPLPAPARGRLDDLRRLLNIADDRDWCLIVAWLVAALRDRGPYPILSLHGEQGSAKSTAARLLRRVIDPHKVCLRSEPKEARDLAITAGNSWVVALDNLSGLPGWLSDALCRLATGGGFGTRQLYSDDEEMLFDAQRPIILNGIAAVGARPDLLERSLLIELPTIADENRRTEADLFAEFEAALPGILGGLLDAVAGALRDRPGVKLDRLPRMADFAAWAMSAEGALGWRPGTFIGAYADARQQAVEAALDASPIADPIRRLLDDAGEWHGTASELLDRLRLIAGDGATRAEDWPRRANTLSAQLRRLAPDFRRAGISVRWERQSRKRTKVIHLEKATDSSSASSAPGNDGNSSSAGPSARSSASAAPSAAPSEIISDSPSNLWPANGADGGDDHSPGFSAAEPTPSGQAWLAELDRRNGTAHVASDLDPADQAALDWINASEGPDRGDRR